MKIIDFHTHTFPDRIAGMALKSLSAEANCRAHSDGTVTGLKKSMDTAGIDMAVTLPVVTNPNKTGHMNQHAAKLNESFEETGIFSIGGIHPETPDMKVAVKEAADLGLKGLKLHPDYYKVSFNDIRMKRLMSAASEEGLFILTHAGMDIGLYPPICCDLDSIIDVLEDVKPETLILAHMGGWMNWEEVTERLAPIAAEYNSASRAGKGVYLDTAFSIGEIDWLDDNMHKAYHQMSDDCFRRMVRVFGADRILFATDSPWADQKDYVDRVKNMGLSEEELEKIMHLNAEQVLNI